MEQLGSLVQGKIDVLSSTQETIWSINGSMKVDQLSPTPIHIKLRFESHTVHLG